jgi:hypothetical protein
MLKLGQKLGVGEFISLQMSEKYLLNPSGSPGRFRTDHAF